jgi:hypothetical protein
MRTTVKAAWAATAVTFLTLVAAAAPASANATGDRTRGGCFFDTDENDFLTSDVHDGVIGDLSVTTDPAGLPTGATVTCYLEVSGVEAPGTRFTYSGTGVQAGIHRITFTDPVYDNVDECEQVTYADGTTEPLFCPPIDSIQFPPQFIFDALDEAKALLAPIVCPVLVSLGEATDGRIAGAIRIDPDGDLYLAKPIGPAYYRVYDCPPL